jgi:hypothetical protein
MKLFLRFAVLALFIGTGGLRAQNTDLGELHGNFQIDAQYYNPDTIIGAPMVPEKMRMNSFTNLIYTRGNISAGIRYESYLNTILGFDPRYKGNGIPFRYASFANDGLDITVGSYYEQFGSGLIFRTYEERGLGYDNAMDGVRVKYKLHPGVELKGVIGKQRIFFESGPGIVRGLDGEVSLNDVITGLAEKKTRVMIGGSFVSKYETDQDPLYQLPENVGCGGGRIKVIRDKINVYAEYAYKINDPGTANLLKGNYNYNNGQALYVNTAYSQKGLGFSLGAKVIDNMNFRSDRTATGNNLLINYLPALSRQHTYNLAATIYPYAVQPNGEIGLQAELIYTIKKGSLLGGEYGTTVIVNYASANGLDTTINSDGFTYKTNYNRMGDVYFKDFNIEINRKINKNVKATLFYANFVYNKDVVLGLSGFGTVFANIEVVDVLWKINSKHAIRFELEGLQTKQDFGDWFAGLIEYTVSPQWFFAVLAQYNYGNPDETKRVWYPNATVGYVQNASRISLSYGRQREGIFCVGGICRFVPASNGLTLTITSSF